MSRASWAIGGAAALAAVSVAGCAAQVSGTAIAHRSPPPRHIAAPLSDLLLQPTEFAPPYSAVVLPAPAVQQASQDVTGIPAEAKVQPRGCLPPRQRYGPDDTAIVVGTDNTARATITVELTRTDRPLAERREQLDKCKDVTVTSEGAKSTVRSSLTPAPPIDADDTFAAQQTVTSGSGSAEVKQSMLTLGAQVGDVRVTATYMTFGTNPPDTAALDRLFTDAVQRVHRAE